MRVLLVHYKLGDLGGAEANVRHVANGLRERGAEVALLFGDEADKGADRFRQSFSECYPWVGLPADEAVRRAMAFKPDVIYVHKIDDMEVLQALTTCGVPLVRMVHDHDMYCQRSSRYFPWNRRICKRRAGYACAITCSVVRDREGPLPLKLVRPGVKLRELELCRRFNHHVVVTNYMKDELVLHDFPAEHISILPPVPKAAAEGFAPQYSEPLVLFVGQILRGKGVDAMIRSLQQCRTPGWRALIIGDGTHRAQCEQVVDELGLRDRVQFTGWVDQDSLQDYYRSARVAVVPSLWPEPIATIGLELMQHAIPVVAFDAGGIRDWLKNGENGYLVPLIDEPAMGRAIDTLLADPSLCRRMGEDGLAKGRQWHDQRQYFDQVSELLAGQAAAGVRSKHA